MEEAFSQSFIGLSQSRHGRLNLQRFHCGPCARLLKTQKRNKRLLLCLSLLMYVLLSAKETRDSAAQQNKFKVQKLHESRGKGQDVIPLYVEKQAPLDVAKSDIVGIERPSMNQSFGKRILKRQWSHALYMCRPVVFPCDDKLDDRRKTSRHEKASERERDSGRNRKKKKKYSSASLKFQTTQPNPIFNLTNIAHEPFREYINAHY
ncbi:hypothetical protein H6P81_006879 [Aristolochia fimbriata]|uniref:Uncharacterized protein n=1 Tax=Aristolochia fimbriata TaxID=158543 RepID=A0AAV7EYJ1_ARIFI|nr:hypothetical protein H6P81_006879 [Aristolochia fimbriata]